MTWESGPALPPGTLVLSPEQAATLREAMTKIGEMFAMFAAEWAKAAPQIADSINAALPSLPPVGPDVDPDEASEVHLRAVPSEPDLRMIALANPRGTRDLLTWLTDPAADDEGDRS
jgi:hypothetical protein